MKNKVINPMGKNFLEGLKEKKAKEEPKAIIFRVPTQLKSDFEEIAKRNNLSVSEILVDFVEQFVEANNKNKK